MLEKDPAKRNEINHVVEALYALKIAAIAVCIAATASFFRFSSKGKILTKGLIGGTIVGTVAYGL